MDRCYYNVQILLCILYYYNRWHWTLNSIDQYPRQELSLIMDVHLQSHVNTPINSKYQWFQTNVIIVVFCQSSVFFLYFCKIQYQICLGKVNLSISFESILNEVTEMSMQVK